MKKRLLATVILGSVFGVAHADDGSSIELYGILDVAVGGVEHSANANPLFPATVNPVSKVSTKFNQPVYGMFNGGISDSRWGLRGTEDLGGGMQAFFDLESVSTCRREPSIMRPERSPVQTIVSAPHPR